MSFAPGTALQNGHYIVDALLEAAPNGDLYWRSEEHTSELQSRPHISYAVFCLKKKKKKTKEQQMIKTKKK